MPLLIFVFNNNKNNSCFTLFDDFRPYLYSNLNNGTFVPEKVLKNNMNNQSCSIMLII